MHDWRRQLKAGLIDVLRRRGLSQKRAAAAITSRLREQEPGAPEFSESTFGMVLRGKGVASASIDAVLTGLGLNVRIRLVEPSTGETFPVRRVESDRSLLTDPDQPGRESIEEQRSMRKKTDGQLELIDLAWSVPERDAEFCYDALSRAITDRRRLHEGNDTETRQT